VQNAELSDNSVLKKETTTDDSGRFVIDSMEYGNYSIEVNDREISAALIAATVSSPSPGQIIDTLRPYAGISGNIGLKTGPSSRMLRSA
jgi:hypothetical protein